MLPIGSVPCSSSHSERTGQTSPYIISIIYDVRININLTYPAINRSMTGPCNWVRKPMAATRITIFDTTLRDGEQSPGCSMTVNEKLRMARKLVDLGVDILEAGFPIASEGDFEAVDAVSREYPWVQVAALARACTLDVERAASSLRHARR